MSIAPEQIETESTTGNALKLDSRVFTFFELRQHPENRWIGTAKNNKIKKFQLFAKFSPFKSFRINKQVGESSKICTELRRIYDKQLF